jgi:AGCS family alanine or glycine:cation symporter
MVIGSTYYGSVKSADLAWALGDIGVGSMAWLNLIAIVLLRKPALKAWKDYREQRKAGKDPVFRAEDLGIKNASYWDEKHQS